MDDQMDAQYEFVTDRQWDGVAARLEQKNMRDRGLSLSRVAIARAAAPYIIEIQPDRKGMIVRSGWKVAMRQAAQLELHT